MMYPEIVPPVARVPRPKDLSWRRTAARWFVGAPFVAVAVFWAGYLPHLGDGDYVMWPMGMWAAALVLLPMAIVGAVWGHRAGSASTRTWGIIAAVVCSPAAVMGLFVLGVIVF